MGKRQESLDRRDCLKLGTAAGVALITAGTSIAAEEKKAETTPAMDAIEAIMKRRTVRSYKPDPVPEEHLNKILSAGNMAATAGNQQPWKFLVVKDRKTIDAMMPELLKFFKKQLDKNNVPQDKQKEILDNAEKSTAKYMTAPVYVLVLVDKQSKYPSYTIYDGTLAAANIMIAARALGYGTVFMTDAIPPEVSKKVLNIPDRYERICMFPIGIPQAWPETPKKKELKEVVCYEKIV